MSPPLLEDEGSAELTFASFAKSAPERSCLTRLSAFAFAAASSSGLAFGSTLLRMWRIWPPPPPLVLFLHRVVALPNFGLRRHDLRTQAIGIRHKVFHRALLTV